MRRLIRLFMLMALAGVAIWPPSPAFADHCGIKQVVCPHAEGDQENGGVRVGVEQTSGGESAAVAQCPECEYLYTPSCQGNAVGETAGCGNASASCIEPGHLRMRIYRRTSPTSDWELIATVCRGPADDSDGPSIGELIRREARDLFEPPAPSYQPVRGAIVNLPTLFASGQPDHYEGEPHNLLGFTVQIFATPTWEWTFEPGVTKTFDKPGGPYPDYSVAHTYEDTGTYGVELVTSWTAEYTVNGEGPFPVPGEPITQTAELTVDVREARAVLVAD